MNAPRDRRARRAAGSLPRGERRPPRGGAPRGGPRARRGALLALALAALAPLAAPGAARAHVRSVSYSVWRVGTDGRVEVALRVALRDLALRPELAEGAAVVARWAQRHVSVSRDRVPCDPVSAAAGAEAPGWMRIRLAFACPAGDAPLEARVELLAAERPAHLHLASGFVDGRLVAEAVLEGRRRAFAIPGRAEGVRGEGAADGLLRFVGLGVEHLVGGPDHLAFLLGLLLLARTLGEAVRAATGFTIGHSATLALAAAGLVRPAEGAVEAAIGLSVLVVALEAGWLRAGAGIRSGIAGLGAIVGFGLVLAGAGAGVPLPVVLGVGALAAAEGVAARAGLGGAARAALPAGFGLVHGFGFAGALASLALPRERLVAGLFGFNAGIELAQLVLLAVAWPLLAAAAGSRAGRFALPALHAAVAAAGAYWFAARALA